MDHIEVHPINSRVVCFNQHHLQPVWILKALCSTLGSYYNNKLLQVIWTRVNIALPNQKCVQIKGHSSHTSTRAVPTLNTIAKTGTYLTFCVPPNKDMHSHKLIINGVEPAVRGGTPSKINVQLVMNEETNNTTEESQLSSTLEELSLNNLPYRNQQNHTNKTNQYKSNNTEACIEIDLNDHEQIITILEEEENISSDEEFDDDDIHKVVRRRIVVDIESLIAKWKETSQDLLVILLKPGEYNQAWQFRSAYISASLKPQISCNRDLNLPKRTNIIRRRPVTSSNNCSTLNRRKISPNSNGTQFIKEQIDPASDIEVTVS